MSALNRYLEKVKLAGLLKEAMMGNSPLAQTMNRQSSQSMRASGMPSGLPGYKKGGPVKKEGYLTDKKGKPYARVHKGEMVVPKDTKTKEARLIGIGNKLKAKIRDSRNPAVVALKSVGSKIDDSLHIGLPKVKKRLKKRKKKLKNKLITSLGGSTAEGRQMAVARVTRKAKRQKKRDKRAYQGALEREDFWKNKYLKTKQAWVKIANTVQEKQDVALGSSTLAKELAKPKKRSMVNQLRDFAAKKTRSGRGPNNPLERRSVREAPARYRSGSWELTPTEDLGRSVHLQRRLKVPGPKGSTPYRTGDRTPSGGIIGKTVLRERSEKPREVKVIPVPKKAPKPKRPTKAETRYGSKPGMTLTLPPVKLVGKAPNLVGDDFKSRAKWLRSRGESWGSPEIREKWKPGTKRVMNQWWRTRKGARTAQQYARILTGLDVKPVLKAVAAPLRKAPKKKVLVAKS